jgi:hypothetical protein
MNDKAMFKILRKALAYPRRYCQFQSDWRRFSAASTAAGEPRFRLAWADRMPALWENTSTTAYDAHYIYHPAWAARVLMRLKPAKHIDISSSLHFCTMVSAMIPVDFYDYRPVPLSLDNLTCGRADLTQLPFEDDSIETLSCMHTVEHVGLGRYGDPIDPRGDLIAIAELKRVVRTGGHLLFVVPVGEPKIYYNSHRVYAFDQVVAMFDGFTLVEHALVRDNATFVMNPDPAEFDAQHYGCGCFVLRKL